MRTLEYRIEIHRPVEAVFAFVADQRTGPQWQGAMKAVRVTSDGPPTVGTTSTRVGSFLGRKVEAQSEITALEPNRALRTQGTFAAVRLSATLRVEAAAPLKVELLDKVEDLSTKGSELFENFQEEVSDAERSCS